MNTTTQFNPCRLCALDRNAGPEDGGCPDPVLHDEWLTDDAARYDQVHGDWDAA